MRESLPAGDFLTRLDIASRRHFSVEPKISSFLSFIACGTILNFSMMALGTSHILWVALAIATVVLFCIPALVFLRSNSLSRSKRTELFQQIGLAGAERFLLRTKNQGDLASIDCGFLRFICLPERAVSIASDESQQKLLRCKLAHELAHLKGRDPLRLSLQISFVLVSIVALGAFVEAELSAPPHAHGVVGTEARPISYLVISIFFLLSGYATYVLFSFVHRRESSADAVAYDLIGEEYRAFIAVHAKAEKFKIPKSWRVGLWNRITHPRFAHRLRDLRRPATTAFWYPSLVLLQSYTIVLAAPLAIFIFDEALSDVIWRRAERNIDTVISDWWRAFIWISMVQWFVFAYAFAGEARSIWRAGLAALPVFFGAVIALYVFDSWLIGELLATPQAAAHSDIRYVYESMPLFRVPTLLASIFLFSAATSISRSQAQKPYGVGWLQNLNAALFSVRMSIFLFLAILAGGSFDLDFAAISIAIWVGIEVVAEFLRYGRIALLRRRRADNH